MLAQGGKSAFPCAGLRDAGNGWWTALDRSPIPPALPGERPSSWLCFWLIIIIYYHYYYYSSNHSLPSIPYAFASFLAGCRWFCASHPDHRDAEHPIGKIIFFLTGIFFSFNCNEGAFLLTIRSPDVMHKWFVYSGGGDLKQDRKPGWQINVGEKKVFWKRDLWSASICQNRISQKKLVIKARVQEGNRSGMGD